MGRPPVARRTKPSIVVPGDSKALPCKSCRRAATSDIGQDTLPAPLHVMYWDVPSSQTILKFAKFGHVEVIDATKCASKNNAEVISWAVPSAALGVRSVRQRRNMASTPNLLGECICDGTSLAHVALVQQNLGLVSGSVPDNPGLRYA